MVKTKTTKPTKPKKTASIAPIDDDTVDVSVELPIAHPEAPSEPEVASEAPSADVEPTVVVPPQPPTTDQHVANGASSFKQIKLFRGEPVIKPVTIRLQHGQMYYEVITAKTSHLLSKGEYEQLS